MTLDEKKLFARKNNHCGYTFCPLCGKKLVRSTEAGRWRMVCADESCGFVFYQNPVPAAGAIIVENDKILLVKRAHHPKVDWWCIPAGYMEWDEHPSETAVREVREETGLEIELRSLFEVYSGDDDPRTNAVLVLYLADRSGGEMRAGDDASEVRFFGFDELPESLAFEAHNQAIADYRGRILSTQ